MKTKIKTDLSEEDLFLEPEQLIELERIKKKIEKENKEKKESKDNKLILMNVCEDLDIRYLE